MDKNMRHECGLYLGRFQPLHIGHASIIDKMFDECDTVIIAIGSAQKSGTIRNPLNYEFRKQLIKITYSHQIGARLIILPIKDRDTYSDDSSWGEYVFKQIYEQCGLRPNVIYEGYENERSRWYDSCNIPVIKVPRHHIPISGTDLRKAIKADYKKFVLPYLPAPIREYYNDIRKEIEKCSK